MTDRYTIENKVRSIIKDQQYCDNWFGAVSFFKERFVTGLLKKKYFITRDEMLTNKGIYALREITPDRIKTVAGPLDSAEEAKEILKGLK